MLYYQRILSLIKVFVFLNSYQGDEIAGGGQTLKSMRVLRVFRPLRVVNKLEKLKVTASVYT